ncbi:hypothetical protein CBM2598_U20054 [Cupriavidus taiwanensis]|nr:hypothetical protein CBM2598_U20054 [Cupriavidus taiwanensis]
MAVASADSCDTAATALPRRGGLAIAVMIVWNLRQTETANQHSRETFLETDHHHSHGRSGLCVGRRVGA